ncbi:hypothetical protein, partial [Burkholderia pseudomallei]
QALRLVERFSALGTRDQRDVVGRVNAESPLATLDVNTTAAPLPDARDRQLPIGLAVAVFGALSAWVASNAATRGSLGFWIACALFFGAFAAHGWRRRARVARETRERAWHDFVLARGEAAERNMRAAREALMAWERAQPDRAFALDREDPRLIAPSRLAPR